MTLIIMSNIAGILDFSYKGRFAGALGPPSPSFSDTNEIIFTLQRSLVLFDGDGAPGYVVN